MSLVATRLDHINHSPAASIRDRYRSRMELTGTWRATVADEQLRRTFSEIDHDDGAWPELEVPGHWANVAELAGAESVLYRRRFEGPDPAADPDGADWFEPGLAVDRLRWWLRIDGICQQGDVWLDGAYLGATDGYFVPHQIEVTDQIRVGHDHVLAIEANSRRFGDPDNRTTLTGALQDPELCGSTDLVPGGLWRPLRLRSTGEIAITHFRAVCADAGVARARIALRVVLDVPGGGSVELRTRVAGTEHVHTHPAAAGENRVEWTVDVADPELWWPHTLGGQPLHDATVEARAEGLVHDRRQFRVGFRSVTMRNWIMVVNGERLFLKGANVLPTAPLPADATAAEVAADVESARNAGLDIIRPIAHVARPELYDTSDELGMLVWQDLPIRGVMSRTVRDQAGRQAREIVDLLGHHPSVVVWCGHDEPFPRPERPTPAPAMIGTPRPSWNRIMLDRSLGRIMNRCDGSRPVVLHTAVPASLPTGTGTTSHLWFGRHGGRAADLGPVLARRPQLGRFVTAFGASSAPLDGGSPSGQAEVVKTTIETLRRLKYEPTGGFLLHVLADAGPRAAGLGVLDHRRRPKPGWAALVDACRDLIVVSDPLPERLHPGERLDLAVHVVSDRRHRIDAAVVSVRVVSATRTITTRRWTGVIGADACTYIGRVDATAPPGPGQLTIELELTVAGAKSGADREPFTITNRYVSMIT